MGTKKREMKGRTRGKETKNRITGSRKAAEPIPKKTATANGMQLRRKYGWKGLISAQQGDETGGKVYVTDIERTREERGNFYGSEACDTATDLRHKEFQLGMLPREADKLVDIGRNGLHATLHGRNGITLSLQSHALPPHGAETLECKASGTAAVHAREVTPEDEDLVGLQ